jgi:hypothetical protein
MQVEYGVEIGDGGKGASLGVGWVGAAGGGVRRRRRRRRRGDHHLASAAALPLLSSPLWVCLVTRVHRELVSTLVQADTS